MSTKAPSEVQPVDLNQELTSGFAHKFIRHKTKQLIGRYGIRSADREDLCQEMKLRLIRRHPQFDPQKSDWPAFVTTVVERHVATILESRRRKKRRGAGQEVSLSDPALDEDGIEVSLGELVGIDDLNRMTYQYDHSDEEWADLEMDLETALEGLPVSVRELCQHLKTKSILAAAREMNMCRDAARMALQRIRPVLERHGFQSPIEQSVDDIVTVDEC